ncbi:Survival protein SurA precursor (Peptidyl-prolyl cis-trans isomerase SurA) [Dissulfuribacter thermophilus]|uniref:Survival protein SurA (Peptidyl-prolyl cis-trans isomerase SurA) n=1 Tax=Dissulfuribacter thermophilus TaxID=1156395 RepID=A0A1B9F446_9BACT|nr:SurA N-terminal domain-containing protein [Dissulfuribacter thermophilus]OCC14706.1 Survival protein SurA precursor (Peptidyl-prolyl cis-trans isomerase SurA) [Dissulfuribacter thermophilus]
MKKHLFFVLIVTFFISHTIILRPTYGEIVDRIVAIVDNDCITLSELKDKAKDILRRTGQTGRPLDDTLLAQILPQVIDQHLIKKEIEDRGIKVSKKEVDLALDEILKSNGLTIKELEDILKKQGKDLDAYREEIRTQIEHSRLISSEVRGKIVVTDEEIEAYLKEHPLKDLKKGPIYELQDIFIGFDGQHRTREEAKKEALKILKELKEPQTQNAVMEKFQDIGSFTLSEMAPFLKEHVKHLKKGEISNIIETETGFHILRVKDILSSNEESLNAQKREIRNLLFKKKLNQQFEEWLKELRQKASIRILL